MTAWQLAQLNVGHLHHPVDHLSARLAVEGPGPAVFTFARPEPPPAE